jgi:predicted phosphodiesterase
VRVGLISDIHANRDALVAVLAQLSGVDLTICCGDIVGYYDEPNEVCSLLREKGVRCIRGNHDAYVLGDLAPDETRRKAYRTDWTREVLDQGHLDWLRSLPTELHFVWSGLSLRVRHASPWDEETYLYRDAANALERLHIPPGETLAVGHTHYPLHVPVGEGWLLNPGSVGQPRDRDPRPSYATIDTETGEVQHVRAAYDVAAMQDRLSRQGWDPAMIAILSRTR